MDAIKTMKIRGAPAIGVAGAMGIALSAKSSRAKTKEQLLKDIQKDAQELRSARPTAINLSWGIDKILEFIKTKLPEDLSSKDFKASLVDFAKTLADMDVRANIELSELGQSLIPKRASVLTHCKWSLGNPRSSRARVH